MKPTDLMKACGSKSGGWEPESPAHWTWLLRNGEGPERALAWIKLKSIAHASPCCVDDAGQPLGIESLAADLGLALKTARNYCYALAEQGRIKTQNGRLWYRADVPESTGTELPAESEEEDQIAFVQRHFPAYLHDSIKKLPARDFERLERCCHWCDDVHADAIRAVRAITERVQDSTLAQVGVKEKIRLPKREPQHSEFLDLRLRAEPDFVQSHSVQTGPNGLDEAAGESVRNGLTREAASPTPVESSAPANGNRGASSASTSATTREVAAAATASLRTAAAAAGHVVPLAQINAVCDRCNVLDLQLPDRNLILQLLTRFAGIDPLIWPRFPEQKSPGLWLHKTPEQMRAEIERQRGAATNGAKPRSTQTYERLMARAKQAGSVS